MKKDIKTTVAVFSAIALSCLFFYLPVLNKIGIDVDFAYDLERALSFVSHDKKRSGDEIEVVFSDKIHSRSWDTVQRRIFS